MLCYIITHNDVKYSRLSRASAGFWLATLPFKRSFVIQDSVDLESRALTSKTLRKIGKTTQNCGRSNSKEENKRICERDKEYVKPYPQTCLNTRKERKTKHKSHIRKPYRSSRTIIYTHSHTRFRKEASLIRRRCAFSSLPMESFH